jgi:type IV pilus assembly protein PilM
MVKIKLPRLKIPHIQLAPQKKGGYIGVTLEDEGLRYAEVRVTSSRVHVRQAGFVEIDRGLIENGKIVDPDKTLLQLALGMKDTRLKRKKAVLAVPTSAVVVRKVSLPNVSLKDVRSLLEVELDSTIHLPFPRPYFDFYKLDGVEASETENSTESNHDEEEPLDQYLVVAAPGDMIDQYIDLFKELGIHLAAIDIEPLALHRLLPPDSIREGIDDCMYMQLDLHTVNVSFFKKNIPEFIRNIPLDLKNYQIKVEGMSMQAHDLLQQLEERGLFQSFASDLVREIERMITFYQFSMKNDGTHIKKIYVTGDFAEQDRIISMMKERISNIDIIPFPIEHIKHPFSDDKEIQAYTVPIGLSMKG